MSTIDLWSTVALLVPVLRDRLKEYDYWAIDRKDLFGQTYNC